MQFFRRRNYFVKRAFQGRFILRFIITSLVVALLAVAAFVFLAKGRLNEALFSMRLPSSGPSALLAREAALASVGAVVAISLLYLLAARSMYHKITGPLQRMRTDFQRILAGDLGCRVVLRDPDEFKDFAAEINLMVEALGRRYAGLQAQTAALADTAKALENASHPDEARALTARLADELRAVREQLKEVSL